jgi:hypothetical protein
MLKIMRTTAMTNKRWMSPPPKCNANPSNHKTNSTTMIAHNRPAMLSLPPLLDYTRRVMRTGGVLAVAGDGPDGDKPASLPLLNNATRNSPTLYKYLTLPANVNMQTLSSLDYIVVELFSPAAPTGLKTIEYCLVGITSRTLAKVD